MWIKMAIEEKTGKKAKRAAKRKLSILQTNTNFNATIGTDKVKPPSSSKGKSRNYEMDLLEYLSNWERRDTIPWKFNKVIQAWAISNLLEEGKISSSTFKQLCPYLMSVQGAARSRLIEDVNKVISDAESQIETEEVSTERSISEKTLKRAIKVKKLLVE